MKKLISLIMSMLMILSAVSAVYAAPASDDISYTVRIGTDDDGNATQTVIIKGEGIAEAANKFVALRIWKDGMSDADYDEDPSAREDDIDLFAVLLQTTANADGDFTFEFLFDEECAEYIADIKVQGEELVSIPVTTADMDAVRDFIDTINDDEELAVMAADDFDVVLDNPGNYGLNLAVFNRLTSTNKTKALEAVIDVLIDNNDDSIRNTMVTVSDALAENVLKEIFDQTDDEEILLEAFDVYEDLLDIENLENASGIDELYYGFGDEQGEVLAAMGKTSYGDKEEILDAFKEKVFLKAIKDTQYYSELAPIIENNFDYLELDGDDEDEYTDSSSVRTHVLKALNKSKSSMDSIAEFREKFSDAVGSYDKDSNDRGGNGGGSGYSSNVTVSTDLMPSEGVVSAAVAFSDINGHWAQRAVTYLSNKHIISGRGDGTFDPEGQVTRAEYVKMIVEAYGLYDSRATAEFTDISTSDWYYGYVASMVKRGYILGDDTGAFNPNALISRQDMAVILYRTLQGNNLVPALNTLEKLFADFDDVSAYAQNSVTYLSNMKLINGSDGMFRPHDSSTRAEAAQIIFNAVMEVGNE